MPGKFGSLLFFFLLLLFVFAKVLESFLIWMNLMITVTDNP